ncbi:MAG: C10 family peptidase [Lentimicrobiaceae bacterium]|nr:C10 family peptidase [Lentimicrobiaceae bacterium]MCB9023468.1 C10 family peptidase [Lentimicrobiaceae bacterium]
MKLGKLLSLAIAIVLASNAFAGIVTPNNAATVAQGFIYEQMVQKGEALNFNDIQLEVVKVQEYNGQPVFYAFNVTRGGYVVISADDIYTPVIGYSSTGSFPSMDENLNFRSFMMSYAEQIDFGRSNNARAEASTVQAWDYYSNLSSARVSLDGYRDVEPLLTILWNQDYPYNAYCPEDAAGPGGRVYAGCVATAMSMIMTYYRYPEVGIGSYSYNCPPYGTLTANFGQTHYNWDAMLNSINAGNGQAVNAVAELQYHCGVAVRMGYAPDGSGAYSADVPNAIKNYFGYSTSAQYLQKMAYTLAVWEGMLKTSIDEMKPLYYSGQSPDGGHAFVCDGYQETASGNLFHFNFGWSGSGNGFFTLSDVGGFSSQQGMVRNFIPNPANYPYDCDAHVITTPLGIFEDRSGPLGNYLANSACSWLIDPSDSVNSISINFNSLLLGTGDSIKIYDGENENAPMLAAYGQGSSTSQVTSTGSKMFVRFITDGSDEAQGFQAEFNSSYPVYCTSSITNLTDPIGSFSDGSGEHNYNNSTVCKWKIMPGVGAQDLTLAFTSFDLEPDKDNLRVYAIPTNELLANLSGNTIPEPIVSPTGQMMIMFSTNGFNNFQGFDAEYYISNVGTTEQDFAKNLAVYPNPASGYTQIKFNLQQSSQVNFSIFNLVGEQVYNETSSILAGFVDKTLQLGNIAKGVYVLRINSDQGSISRRLVIN